MESGRWNTSFMRHLPYAFHPKVNQNAGNDPNAATCGGCHIGIVDIDGNIIDTDRHINGKKNVFGN